MTSYRSGFVASLDGTSIGYRWIGHGAGIVLVQGAMGTAYNYDQLARALADAFTVYLPDRRGRGMSPLAYTPVHTIREDIEDIDGIVAQSGARLIFGLSSGAIIALAASESLAAIDKAVIYEPPFYPQGISHPLIRRFNREVEQDRLAAALVTASRIVGLGPRIFPLVPRQILELGTKRALDRETREGSGSYAPLRELIPAMRYDFKVVSDMDGKVESFAGFSKDVLLLGGDRSPYYLKAALARLEKVIPAAARVEVRGVNHSGPWNADRGGNPELIAHELIKFFE